MNDRSKRDEKGRYLKAPDALKHGFTVKFSDADFQRLKAKCAAIGVSPAVLLREMSLDWLEQQEQSKSKAA